MRIDAAVPMRWRADLSMTKRGDDQHRQAEGHGEDPMKRRGEWCTHDVPSRDENGRRREGDADDYVSAEGLIFSASILCADLKKLPVN